MMIGNDKNNINNKVMPFYQFSSTPSISIGGLFHTQSMPHFQNSFKSSPQMMRMDDDYITTEQQPSMLLSIDDGDDFFSTTASSNNNNEDEELDEDRKYYQSLLGVDLDSFRNGTVMQKLFADIQSSRQPVAHEAIFLTIAVLGFLLNVILLGFQCSLSRRRSSSINRNQRILIAMLSIAHATYCFVHIAEFAILVSGAAGLWTVCLQMLKKRTLKSFCNLIVIGSISGCAVDNYLAVCRPMFHRFQCTRRLSIFVTLTTTYIMSAFFLSCSDFLLPFRTDSECAKTMKNSDLLFETSQLQQSSTPTVIFSMFELSSSNDLKNFCQFIDDCRKHTPVIELAIVFVWMVAAGIVSFSYISVVVVLRNSVYFVFNHSSETTNSNKTNNNGQQRAATVSSSSWNRRRGESLVSQNGGGAVNEQLLPASAQPFRRCKLSTASAITHCSSVDHPALPPALQFQLSGSHRAPIAKACSQGSMTSFNSNNSQQSAGDSPPNSRLTAQLSLRNSNCGNNNNAGVSTNNNNNNTNNNIMNKREITWRRMKARRSSSISQVQRLTLLRNRRRSSYALLIILGVFIITWLPVVAFQIANEFFFTEHFRVNVLPDFLPFLVFLTPLQLINSVIDPVVYSFTYGEMRRWLIRRWKK